MRRFELSATHIFPRLSGAIRVNLPIATPAAGSPSPLSRVSPPPAISETEPPAPYLRICPSVREVHVADCIHREASREPGRSLDAQRRDHPAGIGCENPADPRLGNRAVPPISDVDVVVSVDRHAERIREPSLGGWGGSVGLRREVFVRVPQRHHIPEFGTAVRRAGPGKRRDDAERVDATHSVVGKIRDVDVTQESTATDRDRRALLRLPPRRPR